MREERVKVVVTCEHGGNEIPPEYAHLFKEAAEALASHRGYDLGALELYRLFAGQADFSSYSTTSRLLVELNRSEHHPKLFSEFTQPLSTQEKKEVLDHHYHPYRHQVESRIAHWVELGHPVLHLSVHSFTPELNGKVRNTDVGLLYDPSREREQLFAAHWRQQLQQQMPRLKVRYNYPYKGTADGFVTYLRKQFDNSQYAGLELEVNQRFPLEDPVMLLELEQVLVQTFWQAV